MWSYIYSMIWIVFANPLTGHSNKGARRHIPVTEIRRPHRLPDPSGRPVRRVPTSPSQASRCRFRVDGAVDGCDRPTTPGSERLPASRDDHPAWRRPSKQIHSSPLPEHLNRTCRAARHGASSPCRPSRCREMKRMQRTVDGHAVDSDSVVVIAPPIGENWPPDLAATVTQTGEAAQRREYSPPFIERPDVAVTSKRRSVRAPVAQLGEKQSPPGDAGSLNVTRQATNARAGRLGQEKPRSGVSTARRS